MKQVATSITNQGQKNQASASKGTRTKHQQARTCNEATSITNQEQKNQASANRNL